MTVPEASGGGRGFGRQLTVYFVVLALCYGAALVLLRPEAGQDPSDLLFLAVMFSPTVGAVVAHFLSGGTIQWGRPNRWMLVALLPAVAGLAVYLLGAAVGWFTQDSAVLRAALIAAPLTIFTASLSAIGEEIGWRGFLWPTLRTRYSFLFSSGLVFVIWWAFHVPVILFGWYGSLGGLPAFTVAILGFTLFIGVLTDRSGSLWPSVVGHGVWNGLVATSFATSRDGVDVPAFAGSDALLGEFGWLAAVASLLLGLVAAWWHLRSSQQPASEPAEAADSAAIG